jgi:predicted enzyme related to lactoylglutathione lyase
VLKLSLAYRDETKELAHFRFRSGQLFEVYGPSNRGRKEKYQRFNGPVLGFEVDDIQLARTEMIARGARFITELEAWEDDMWTMFLGPEDKLFEILRPARSPARHSGDILGICWASVSVRDFAGAMQFFSQVMEMSMVQEDDGEEAARCWLATGHLFELFSSRTKRGQLLPNTAFGLEVDNIEQAREEMESQGIESIGPIEKMEDGYAYSYFRAPDGLICALVFDPKHPPSH